MNSNLEEITLNAANWAGSGTPYTYTINNTSLVNSSLCDLLFNPSTNETIDALSNAKIAGYKLERGKITIYAWGDKPTIDLNASLIIRGCL